jgi:hypothetical protein
MSANGLMKDKNVVHIIIHNRILSSHKHDEMLSFATTCIELESFTLRKISNVTKDK